MPASSPARLDEDFEKAGWFDGINEAAVRLAASWYEHPRVAPHLQSGGINLGALVQHPLTYFLLGSLRTVAVSAAGESADFSPRKDAAEEKMLAGGWKRTARLAMAPAWRAAAAFIEGRQPAGSSRFLVSSDLKHAGPVMEALAADSSCRFLVLRPEFAIRQFGSFLRRGISFYAPPEPLPAARTPEWDSFSRAVEESGVFLFKGISFWQDIREDFRRKFFAEFAALASRSMWFQQFLAEKKVRGLLVDEDVCPFNKGLVLAADRLNLPSVVVQHGAPFWSVPIALAPVSATKIAAWGEYSRELLLEWGVPGEKIEITGVPRYDAFHAADRLISPAAARKAKRELGLTEGKRLLVLATDPFHEAGRADFVGNYLTREELKKLVGVVLKAVDSLEGAELVIKLHPRDRFEAVSREWVREFSPRSRVRLARNYPALPLLSACDVLMTVCSTVAVEAMLLGKPVITINVRGGRDLQPHAENGVAVPARDAESLRNALREILSGGPVNSRLAARRREVLPRYVHALDGRASSRVAALLRQLTREAGRDS